MTARLVAGVFAVACLTLAGCGTKEGERVVEYDRGGDRLQEEKAGKAGQYTLHIPGRPDVTYNVEKGEKVGFRKARDGYVEAFAGDNPAVELERGQANGAYWEFDHKARK